ncbi:MAG: cobalt ECF transporter T component CbiQ [Magnetococcales bacterium]|nr:cobalt ECF transporter T component CbiQ [Magnetococcales bacterium]MBF0321449.1 cobalt ECF transporter T component CbiQ [Magnetococcales bacterium]
MHVLDQIAHENAWSRRGTGGKVFLTFGLMGTALGGSPPFAAILVLVATLLLARLSALVPMRIFLGVLAVPLGFLATGLPVLALSVGWQGGPVLLWSAAGATDAMLLGVRSLATLSAMLLLSMTTPPMRLISLGQRVGLSPVFVDLAMLTYRLLFVLSDVALSGFRSQSFRLGYQGWRTSLRSLSLLVAGLLGRTMHQAQRLETGLAARGHTGALPVLTSLPKTRPLEWIGAVTLPGGIFWASRDLAAIWTGHG